MTWEDLEERFRSKVRVGGPDDCWEWTGTRHRYGYGEYRSHGGKFRASRYLFERVIGPIPPTLCVLHRCDNPPCVNPKHLFLGTHGTNMRDSARKGRKAKGEKHSRAKLRQVQVEMIRRLYDEMEVPLVHLARLYGITPMGIGNIVHRRKWRHVA